MASPMYFWASGLFIVLVVALLALLFYGIWLALSRSGITQSKQKKSLSLTILITLCWLMLLAALAIQGFFGDFTVLPPRLFFAAFPPTLAFAVLTFSGRADFLLKHVHPGWLIAVLSFRIVMEIILWMVFVAGVIPVQMTFEGRNWDILIGLTAPIIAYLCFSKKAIYRKAAIFWNIAGLALLINIFSIAVLSTPVPFRVFMNEPANTFIAYFPFVWLPGFVVPFAFGMHFMSLRKLITARN